jgi:aminopeptidase-like protein/aminoglycoside N3'-acetyltransferase
MPLLSSNKYSREDIVNALQKLGIVRGDIVYFSTGFGFLGQAEGVESSEELNQLFFDSIREVLGREGTILVPTFSYTIGRSLASEPAVFDPVETKSETGPFTEFFRQQSGVNRSLDPMVSVSGIGPGFKELITDLPPTSYGADSIFDRLTTKNAKICNIGLGTNWVPFIHHADWLTKVSYRHDKLFFGEIRDGNRLYRQAWVYAVPTSRSYTTLHGRQLGELAENAGIWKWVPLGRGRAYTASYKDLFDFTLEKLKENRWLTENAPSPEFRSGERKYEIFKLDSTRAQKRISFKDDLPSLYSLSRHALSGGIDEAFELISNWTPITVYQYPTGMNCLDWIIPEKWHCNEACLKTVRDEVVFSSKTEPFHAMSYSLPFEGEVSRDHLFKHLHTSKLIQQAIPVKQALLNRDWGLCCSQITKNSLEEERYRVIIDSGFSSGAMKVGEVVCSGRTKDTIILCAYLDGPGQANETLSGVLIGLNVFNSLQNINTQYTYRLLILSGPAGFASWTSQNKELMSSVIGVLNLRCLGSTFPHNLQLSGMGKNVFEQVCKSVARKTDPECQITEDGKFFEALPSGMNPILSNEKYDFNLPIITLYRSLPEKNIGYPFFGYQTNFDSVDKVNFPAMIDSSGLVSAIISELEMNSMTRIMNDYQEWLVNWFRQRNTKLELAAKTNFFDAGAIDSFGVVELIVGLEEAFAVKFTEEEFQDPRFASIQGLVELLEEKNAG